MDASPGAGVLAWLAGFARFDSPGWLWLLPLIILPWLRSTGQPAVNAWTALLPPDPGSRLIDLGLRALASIVIGLLVLALAGLARIGQSVEHIVTGAEIAILLDRSRSMDEGLIAATDQRHEVAAASRRPAMSQRKRQVAQRLLAEFVAARPDDRFAMLLFSTVPLLVADFSPRQAQVKAGIEVSATGRGLSETDIGSALLAGLARFHDRPYTGPRVILMVSDGGATLAPAMRERLTREIRRERVAIYWIYLRSRFSPGLLDDKALGADAEAAVPEHFLHRFFQSTGMPYRAYEAESPDAMARAIEDIKRIEDRPLRYVETLPDTPLERPLLMAALALILVLTAAATVVAAPRR